ncbi:LysE/ArgO family amino acid transporter [Campylobacter suis]|uniref:Arginine exporter protein ArgO n=1 Tax=Campylobacter suis TaxID=2790657 RepID=A0ABM8Q0K3_9BACT|nr:LysE family transporter [Campylobacter suis]CAD7286319.1 Arginine exporter protein ArgO [Campylobacter suis]
MAEIFINGALLCFSLIIAIGAQNLFIIQQGLSKNHIFWVCLVSFFGDCLVFGLGIFGVGGLAARSENFAILLGISGILFLLWYGINCLISALRGTSFAKISNAQPKPLKVTIAKTIAVSLLNPHVWIDAFIVVGGFGASMASYERPWFFAGTVSASLIWFFSLGYAAAGLSKFFKNARAWQILDSLIAAMMFYMVYLLAIFVLDKF